MKLNFGIFNQKTSSINFLNKQINLREHIYILFNPQLWEASYPTSCKSSYAAFFTQSDTGPLTEKSIFPESQAKSDFPCSFSPTEDLCKNKS